MPAAPPTSLPEAAAAAAAPAIFAEGLWKRYNRRPALRDVGLSLPPGTVTALFGPNGAGNSTLLRLLAGMTRPDQGRACVAGCWLPGERAALRSRIGFLAHQPLLYGELTVEENLRFYARIYDLSDQAA